MSRASFALPLLQALSSSRSSSIGESELFFLLCPKFFSAVPRSPRFSRSVTTSPARRSALGRQRNNSTEYPGHGTNNVSSARGLSQQNQNTVNPRVIVPKEKSSVDPTRDVLVSENGHITWTLDVNESKSEDLISRRKVQKPKRTHVLDLFGKSSVLEAPQPEVIERFVKKHLINKSAREWTLSEIRSKNESSFDWIVPLQELVDAVQRKESILQSRDQDVNYKTAVESFQLVNHDYIGRAISSIPAPSVWTKASLAQYVHDLCRSRMPRQAGRKLHKQTGRHHHEMVREYLEAVIFVKENRALMSAQAFESALRFYYSFEMVHSVRRMFAFMSEIRFPLLDQLFDIILRNTAKHKDLSNFTSLLRGAIILDFIPGERTWVSLYMCLQSHRAREVLLDMIRQEKMVTSLQELQSLAACVVEEILYLNPLTSIDVSELLRDMDRRLGENWFSLRSANTILKALCMSPAGQPIIEFLETMPKRGCNPDIDSLNVLLERCKRAKDISAAIEVVTRLQEAYGITLDQLSCELLFETAWAQEAVNTCRVLWAAACVNGRASWYMERRIIDSILTSRATEVTAGQIQTFSTGCYVLGIDPRQYSKSYIWLINFERPDADSSCPQTITRHISNLVSREHEMDARRAKQLVRSLVNYDQDLSALFCYPVKSFWSQLKDAFARDQQSKRSESEGSTLEQRLASMIRPILVQRS